MGVVLFDSTATSLGGSRLTSSTEETVQRLKREIDNVRPNGGTDFNRGFQLAFDLMTQDCDATETPSCSGCNKVIIFLTDGRDCSQSIPNEGCSLPRNTTGGDGAQHLLSQIESRQQRLEADTGKRAAVFSFSLGSRADDSLPRQIACANAGAWGFIRDGVDPLTAMSTYYTYVAAGRMSTAATWSNPYEDDGGLGTVTTVARPVYSPDGANGVPGVLVGVVGHDVKLTELESEGANHETVLSALVQRSSRCVPLSLSPCQLQVQRSHSGDHAPCTDTLPAASCYRYHKQNEWYLHWFQKTLTFISSCASIEWVWLAVPVVPKVCTATSIGLILARFDTNVSVF